MRKVSIYDKIQHLEDAFGEDIKYERFIPYIMLHEYEALLFSDVEKFFDNFGERVAGELHKVVKKVDGNPELINDSYQTAPSKRIISCCKQYGKREYEKVTDGILMAKKVGLSEMRKKCSHFDKWLSRLESLDSVSKVVDGW